MTTTVQNDRQNTDIAALAVRLREVRRPAYDNEMPPVSQHLRSAFAAARAKSEPDGDKKAASIFIGIFIPSAQK